jgi:hypothetical protein
MIARGVRDLSLALAGACALTALGSLVVGLMAGVPAQRAVAGGLMLVGALVFTAGAFVGLRDPGRSRRRGRAAATSSGPGTWAEAFELSAALVGIGLALVLLGVLLNPNATLT